MSSAILYVAIVAIWAGVLIPRWLRRETPAATATSDSSDSSDQGSGDSAEESGREEDQGSAGAEARERPGPPSRDRQRRPAEAGDAARRRPAEIGDDRPRPTVPEAPARDRERGGSQERGGDRDRDHARMLSARRRLFGLLVLLAIASGVLAGRKLAAWWVVLPPAVMLVGYLALLREAAKADAERRRAGRSREVRAADSAAAAARSGGAAQSGAAARASAGATAASADVPEVPERRAKIIDISASWDEEQLYDQDADAKRRAVGD